MTLLDHACVHGPALYSTPVPEEFQALVTTGDENRDKLAIMA